MILNWSHKAEMTERELAFEQAIAFIEATADQFRARGLKVSDDDEARVLIERAVTCDFLAEDMRRTYFPIAKESK